MGRIIIEGKAYWYENKEITERLGISRMTIYRAMKQGESHPLYGKIIKLLTEKNRNVTQITKQQ